MKIGINIWAIEVINASDVYFKKNVPHYIICRSLHRESPTTDESTSQVNSFQALSRNVDLDRLSQFLVLQSQSAGIGAMHSLPNLNEQTPLLFSHQEHTHSTSASEVTGSTCSRCGHRSDTTSLCCSDIDGSMCPGCGRRLVRVTASSPTDEFIATSFSSLSVTPAISEGVSLASSSLRSGSLRMSCRQQAATCRRSHFDDTTVDDLAGYLDEIMFLPKPMSEMAELMYT